MKLTDTQLVLLSQASQREDRCAQLPLSQKGGAAQKLVAKLIAADLIQEVRAEPDMPVWRKADDGPFALRITDQGLAAISAEEAAPGEPNASTAASQPDKTPAQPRSEPKQSRPRAKTSRRTAGVAKGQAGVQSLILEARCRRRAPAAPAGRNDRRHHEGDRLAAPLGAWVLRRYSPQEARPEPHLRNPRRRAGVSRRAWLGQSRWVRQEEGLNQWSARKT